MFEVVVVAEPAALVDVELFEATCSLSAMFFDVRVPEMEKMNVCL
jgi:hypothetical protein